MVYRYICLTSRLSCGVLFVGRFRFRFYVCQHIVVCRVRLEVCVLGVVFAVLERADWYQDLSILLHKVHETDSIVVFVVEFLFVRLHIFR